MESPPTLVLEDTIAAPSFQAFATGFVLCQMPYPRTRGADGSVHYEKRQGADPALTALLPADMLSAPYVEVVRMRPAEQEIVTSADVAVAGFSLETRVLYRYDPAARAMNVRATVAMRDLPSTAFAPLLRLAVRREFGRRRAEERRAVVDSASASASAPAPAP